MMDRRHRSGPWALCLALLVGSLGAACTPRAHVQPDEAPGRDLPAWWPDAPSEAPPPPAHRLARHEVELAAVDVGQGDGLVLRTGADRVVVIDTGTPAGGRRMLAYLRQVGVERIDLLVLTHPHADHIGGARLLVESLRVREAWVSGYTAGSRVQVRTLEAMAKHGVPVTIARLGLRRALDDDLDIEVLGPREPLIKGSRSDANANSVVLWIRHGEIDFLLTGDAEDPTETRLLEVLRARGPPTFEVLKVAHHGSAHASRAHFLERIRPEFAVVSCGRKNRYGHPAPAAVKRLLAAGARILRTDLQGTIRLRSDGVDVTVDVDNPPAAHAPEPQSGWAAAAGSP